MWIDTPPTVHRSALTITIHARLPEEHDPCDALLARLLGRIDRIAGIDIYLAGIDSDNDQAVRTWAAQHEIKPEWVRARTVTLNLEAGALAKLTDGQGAIPTLMRRRGNDLAVLSPAGL